MILEVMREIRNYFVNGHEVEQGNYEITDGCINLYNQYADGRLILISGSALNGGVYRIKRLQGTDLYKLMPTDSRELTDEEFEGFVFGVHAPPDFLKIVEEIEEFVKSNPVSPYSSESFGSYSYTAAKDENGRILGWREAFKPRLKKFKKMFDEMAESGAFI